MLEKHWQRWQSVGKFADVLPTLPTDGQHWPDLACLLGCYPRHLYKKLSKNAAPRCDSSKNVDANKLLYNQLDRVIPALEHNYYYCVTLYQKIVLSITTNSSYLRPNSDL